jgi:23S rRNA pseudouridine2604 synthase
MATIKLKKPAKDGAAPAAPKRVPERAPVRGAGAGVKTRPTLAQAQAQRAEREARYQEQLRQRFGDRPPEDFRHRGENPAPVQRSTNTAFGARSEPPSAPRSPLRREPRPVLRPPRDPRAPPQRDARAAPARPPARFDPRPPPPPRDTHRAARHDHRPRDDEDARFEHSEHAPGSLRLSKRMSELGIASRREADEWIAKGYVRVDDQVVSELGSRVQPAQRITIDAKAKFQQAQRVTVLINKPVGYVSGQAEDGYEPALVLVTPANQWRDDRSGTRFLREHLKNLVPAGRLDIDSVGLLVLTQDGRVAKQLIGEGSEVEKEYLVRVDGPREGRFAARADGRHLSDEGLALLRHGLELDGEALRPAQVEWVNEDQLRFVLTQGKKRQIRRMCEAVGLQVLGLKRVRIGKVVLGDLPAGQWRYLGLYEKF